MSYGRPAVVPIRDQYSIGDGNDKDHNRDSHKKDKDKVKKQHNDKKDKN